MVSFPPAAPGRWRSGPGPRELTWGLALASAVTAWVWPPVTREASLTGDLLFLATIVSVVFGLASIRRRTAGTREIRVWRWLGVAYGCQALAMLRPVYYDLFAWEAPRWSAPRLLYLVGYAAYWAAIRHVPTDADVRSTPIARGLDRAIVAGVAVVVLAVVLLSAPAAATGDAISRLTAIAFPICDLVTLYLVIRQLDRVADPVWRRTLYLLGAAIPFDLVVDLFYADLLQTSPAAHSVATTIAYGAPYVLVAQAIALYRRAVVVTERARTHAPLPFAPTVAVLAMWAIVLATLTGAARLPLPPVLVAVGTVTLLVLARQLVALHEADRALGARDAAEARFSAVVEHASDGILLVDDTGRCTYASPAFTRMVRASPEQVVGRRLADWIVAEQRSAFCGLLDGRDAARPARDDQAGSVWRVRREDGEFRQLELTVADRRGEPAIRAFLVSARDVTERLALQRYVSENQTVEVVGRLAGGIAHDFNNLLAVIRGNAELLEYGIDGESPAATAARICEAVDRGSALTQRLLGFTRRDHDAVDEVDADATIGAMRPLVERLIARGITVVVQPGAGDAVVRIDRLELERALLNLAVNARDAMPHGGTLTLSTAADDATVSISVRDTGTGMDASTRERLFEPLFTTKPAGRGTGLGLYMTRLMVERAGGRIDVESTPGVGSCFHLRFPRGDAPPPSASTAVTTATPMAMPRSLGAHCVLVVDDEPAVREVVRAGLATQGLVVELAESVDAAEQLLATRGPEHFALVITDLVMPGRSGSDLLVSLHASHPELPVLAISGFAGEAGDDLADRLPDVPLLRKPFTLSALADAVADQLHRSAAAA